MVHLLLGGDFLARGLGVEERKFVWSKMDIQGRSSWNKGETGQIPVQ